MHIALLNLTKKYRNAVTDDAVALMARAYAHQLNYHTGPHWGMKTDSVLFYPDESQVPPGSHKIAFMDDSDQQGVLGWHTEDPSGIYGRVFAGPSIDNNGGVLAGDWSVAVTGSHEVNEMKGDPFCNLYADDGNGKLYSTELSDPVEGPSYQVKLDRGKHAVSVSNFITPAWTDPYAKEGFDYLGKLTAPFTLLKTGYVVWSSEGKVQQQFGDHYPEWKRTQLTSDADPLSRRIRKARQLASIGGH